jgi:hypothetical protein
MLTGNPARRGAWIGSQSGREQIEHQRKGNAGQLMTACEKGLNETVRRPASAVPVASL